MKSIVIFVALLLGVSCDKSKESAEDTAKTTAEKIGVPSEKEIKQDIKKGVEDVLKNKGPKWKVSYKGDLSGKLEGTILTATSIAGNTTLMGADMTPDKKAKADHQIQATVVTRADPPMVMMTLTLADGTKCKSEKEQTSKVKFHDENAKTLKADFKGALTCEGGKKITYEASVDKT